MGHPYNAYRSITTAVLASFCAVATMGVFAQDSEAEAAAESVADKSIRQQHLQLLADSLPAHNVKWLQTGNSEFLAISQVAHSVKPQGTVILLHDAGQHPDWPGSLSDLRTYLPQHGWSTLAIALPNPDLPKPPKAIPAEPRGSESAVEENAEEPESVSAAEIDDIYDEDSDSVDDGVELKRPAIKINEVERGKSEATAIDRIIAAVSFARQSQPGAIVLFGQGIGATRVGAFWQEAGYSENNIRALIFLNAKNQLPLSDFNLLNAINDPSLPVLDVVEQSASQLEAERRKQHFQGMGLNKYQQLPLSLLSGSNELLLKRVYGFLKREVE